MLNLKRIFNLQITVFILSIALIGGLSTFLLIRTQTLERVQIEFEKDLSLLASKLDAEITLLEKQVESLASRTMIRRELNKWYLEEISFQEIVDYTLPRYSDGVAVFENLQYAIRYDHNLTELAVFGELGNVSTPESIEKTLSLNRLDDQDTVEFINPIIHDGNKIGIDQVLFNLSAIRGFSSDTFVEPRIIPVEADETESDIWTNLPLLAEGNYYLFADLSDEYQRTEIRRSFLPYILFIFIFIGLEIVISYISILRTGNRMLAQITDLNRRNIQNERSAAIGQITSGLAHEFNNIFTSMMLDTEMLLHKKNVSGKDHKVLGRVKYGIERSSDLLSKLMEYRNFEKLDFIRINLRQIQGNSFWNEFAFFDMNPEYHHYRHPEVILGNPQQIKVVIQNIFQNAAEAGADELIISTGVMEDLVNHECSHCRFLISGDWIYISIQNNGRNLGKADTTRIFEPFYSTKRIGIGGGIGLAQAAGIMEQHGGHIMIDNAESSGVEVTLLFPRLQE